MTDFYSTLVDRALNRIYGEDLGPEQPEDTTIGGLGGRPMSELEGTTTAVDAAEPEMPVATDAVLNAVNKMKDYTTKPLANITYVPLKAASKEASLRRNTMLDLLLAGEEEGALPDGFAKMYDYGEVEFSALEYLDRLKSDYDRKTKATIDVPMQDKRVMDTVDPQFPMPTTTREPQYVSLEDAPDADIVLDEPIQIETEGLGSRPVAAEESEDPFFDRATEFLTLNEGFRNEPYKDSRGFWTIGIGHLITTKKDLPKEWKNAKLTDDEVKALFKEDYNKHLNEAKKLPMYEKLNEEGKLALLDLTFNMGTNKFNETKWPKFFSALENEDLDTAAQELENSKWFNQVGNRGPRVIDLIQKASYN